MNSLSEILSTVVFENTIQRWITAALLSLLILSLFKLFIWSVTKKFGKDSFSKILKTTRFFFLECWAIYLGLKGLQLSPSWEVLCFRIILIVTLLQVAIWGNGLIQIALDRYFSKRSQQDAAFKTTVELLETVSKALLYIALLLFALNNFGVNITALIAGLGVGGIAVALAAQSILSDLFASLTIVLNKPFVIGDSLILGEFEGKVEHIGLKNTRLRSLGGEEIIFSNNDLLQSRLRNYGRMNERRVVQRMGVTYQTSAQVLRSIPEMVQTIVESQPQTRFDRCTLITLGDFSLIFELVYFAQTSQFFEHAKIQEQILFKIIETFEAQKIDFAYPTQTNFNHPA